MIGIVDSGSGNLTSVSHALSRLNAEHKILTEPKMDEVKALIVPGQGRFGPVMAHLNRSGWSGIIRDWVASGQKLLGICVGMQILFEGSEEDPNSPGLGIMEGQVKRLQAPKIPMMGWSQVSWTEPSFHQGAAYFVNGYVVSKSNYAIATSNYGQAFCSAVRVKETTAMQFHPEKSGRWGQEVLRTWLAS